MLKKYKKLLKREALECISETIDKVISLPLADPDTDDDKLLHSVLAEIKLLADTRLVNVKPQYTISFSPAHAFALRILSVDYVMEVTSYRGNLFNTIAIEVHQQYS